MLTLVISKLIGGIIISEINELIRETERLRAKMIKLEKGKYNSHPEVVTASQELDTVLNEYQKMLENLKADKD